MEKQKSMRDPKNALEIAFTGLAAILLAGIINVQANNQSILNQAINDSVKSIDIVDSSGISVANPAVNFSAVSFSYTPQTTAGVIGTSNQRIRIVNPTGVSTWSAAIAGSAPGANWISGVDNYNFDNPAVGRGRLTVNPSVATVVGLGACTTTDVNKGTAAGFDNGNVDSITIVSASVSGDPFCRWEVQGVDLSQFIPGGQLPGAYSVTMVLSVF